MTQIAEWMMNITEKTRTLAAAGAGLSRLCRILTIARSSKPAMTVLATAAILAAGGCAPKEHSFEEDGAFDPVEPINRAVYGFNKKADFFILRPAGVIYDDFPPFGKTALGNFFGNLGEPKNIVNHVLQKRGDDAVRSTARMVFNSTFGFGGVIDIADKMGIPESENDFGRTIRAYGVNDGAYLMLPLIGPSSLADAPGRVADGFAAPESYVTSDKVRAGVGGMQAARARAAFLDEEDVLEVVLDEYTFIRDTREELRRREVPSDVWGKPEDVWGK